LKTDLSFWEPFRREKESDEALAMVYHGHHIERRIATPAIPSVEVSEALDLDEAAVNRSNNAWHIRNTFNPLHTLLHAS
jgi:hypothetical protein